MVGGATSLTKRGEGRREKIKGVFSVEKAIGGGRLTGHLNFLLVDPFAALPLAPAKEKLSEKRELVNCMSNKSLVDELSDRCLFCFFFFLFFWSK